ncbi:hypothetical protein [Cyanobacterium sp. Dongsha4]|uniref:hypothetical protein n=1 Tax=Cyanobacterium sp. DS4 TaxID=2878255 RepID=UPI002E813A10|nr:hypothetical protein [Cyanobacterium sp. Dongsha4]WVL02514.1 hypothetical protein Dongsha4_18640 [Cyanobacterium sp. Dongsha4]
MKKDLELWVQPLADLGFTQNFNSNRIECTEKDFHIFIIYRPEIPTEPRIMYDAKINDSYRGKFLQGYLSDYPEFFACSQIIHLGYLIPRIEKMRKALKEKDFEYFSCEKVASKSMYDDE